MCACVHVHMCVYVCVGVCMYKYILVYIYHRFLGPYYCQDSFVRELCFCSALQGLSQQSNTNPNRSIRTHMHTQTHILFAACRLQGAILQKSPEILWAPFRKSPAKKMLFFKKDLTAASGVVLCFVIFFPEMFIFCCCCTLEYDRKWRINGT